MNKLKKSLKLRTAEILLAFFILLSGFMLAFSSGSFIVNFNRVGFSMISAVQEGVAGVFGFAKKAVMSVHDVAVLQKEYQALTEKLEDYEYMQRSNTEIRKENERLREQLQFATQLEYKNIAAQIIGRNPDNLYSGITINKGSRSGIKKGMPVMAVQNGNIGIVGKVVTVGITTSLVMPVYDTTCNISARIQNTRDIGIVTGSGSYDSPLMLNYIRKRVLDDFNHGDLVVTSGENDNYMKDIPIGRISRITVLDYESSLEIEIDPVIDFMRLENVLVVDHKNPNDRPKGEAND
ncbi:MAG: rod shape-determining protein MreC [Treponema sp.]|nr:rod shape-determining protein MreC [Spirochaetia bacterium]MDD7458533.1 rod shape-determining protein MreC [Spirochaetales bacterium]MDY5811874.1 rod shape-determining protein MreC [Treponema sp.]MEE1180625.1 rod shape-determining protein MreC [Treponema sp.]